MTSTTLVTKIAGVQHREIEVQRLVDSFPVGTLLLLEPEPTNPHDPNAVKVMWRCHAAYRQLGYVPRQDAKIVVALMDRGVSLICRYIGNRSISIFYLGTTVAEEEEAIQRALL